MYQKLTPKPIPHHQPTVAMITNSELPQNNSKIAATARIHGYRIHGDRIAVIDALRGFALVGIIVAHCAEQYLAGPTPPSAGRLNLFSPLDFAVGDWVGLLTFGKFFTIFSFLFGLSFSIQMTNASKNGRPFVGQTVWRLVIFLVSALSTACFIRAIFSGYTP
jgi:uncharacterized membrane protein